MKGLKEGHSRWCVTLFGNGHPNNFTIFFVTLLLLSPFSCAQTGSPPSDEAMMSNQLKLNPVLGVIFVALILAFFFLGCFSVYIRRCLEDTSRLNGGLVGNLANHRRAATRGLDPALIDTFPTFLYSDVKGLKLGKGELECAVCLNEFEDQETLRLLPKCCHVFHPECIDTWLISHVTCPVCRANLVPIIGEEPRCDVPSRDSMNESTQPTRSLENQESVHEISELAIDLHIGSPEVINPSQPINPNRVPRTTPRRPLAEGKFPRSHSTGHSLIQPGENYERFTLRLPEDVHKKFVKPHLKRAQSNVAFPSARSSKIGYRSSSVGIGRERSNHSNYERFDREGQPDRPGRFATGPFVSRSRSVQSPTEGAVATNLTASGSLLKSVKLPFDRLFGGTEKYDVGERSFTRLTGNSPV